MLLRCFSKRCEKCNHYHPTRYCEADIENPREKQMCSCVQNKDHPEHPHGTLCEQMIQVPVYKKVYEDKKVTKMRIETTETTITDPNGKKTKTRTETSIPYEAIESVGTNVIDYYKPERCPCSGCNGKCCYPRVDCQCGNSLKPNLLFYFCFLLIWFPPVYCIMRPAIDFFGPERFRYENNDVNFCRNYNICISFFIGAMLIFCLILKFAGAF